MNIANNTTELVGNTPLVRLNRISANLGATIVCKLEYMNPAHSVKDRIAVAMIDALQAAGKLTAESIVCLLYTSPSPRDATLSRMPSSA